MKRWIVALAVGLVMLFGGMALRRHHFPAPDRLTRYYWDAFYLAAVMFSAYALVQVIYRLRVPSRQSPPPSGPDPANKRDAYRVSYPPGKGPHLHLTHPRRSPADHDAFSVLNLSEGGISFANPEGLTFNRPLQGVLTFQDGRRADITGKVVWSGEGRVSVKLLAPLASELLMEEQRRMIAGESHGA